VSKTPEGWLVLKCSRNKLLSFALSGSVFGQRLHVITDSGGITEETTVIGVPCLTLRDSTERPETVSVGTNELIGTDPAKLRPALARLMTEQWKKGGIPEKWDGKAAVRIVAELERLLCGVS